MLIRLRNKDKKLVIKDMLDIDFDMSVEESGSKYSVVINHKYTLDEEFIQEADAEDRMGLIADCRNNIENELRNY